jgi:phage baseplate assembly protein W
MATINRKVRQFSDLNLAFTKNPATADVTKKFDEEAIKASLRNLILTKNYERPFHPEIGCQIYYLMFENYDPIMKRVMEQTIFNTVRKFEPRVVLDRVQINTQEDANAIEVTLEFRIINTVDPIKLTTLISRVR